MQAPKHTVHKTGSSGKSWLFPVGGLQGESDRRDLEQSTACEAARAKARGRYMCDVVLIKQNLCNFRLRLLNLGYVMVHLPPDYERIYFHLLG